jgi:hypothetical protein
MKDAASKRLEKFNWNKNEPALWKMNKYKKVQPRTDTNNANSLRSSMHRALSSLKP